MNDSPNDDRDPIAGDADRTRTDRLAPAPDIPIGLSGILPVGGTLSATPGSLMGEGGRIVNVASRSGLQGQLGSQALKSKFQVGSH